MSPERATGQDIIEGALKQRLSSSVSRPLILGICGSQGSGKSFVSESLKRSLEQQGLRVALLSLDDLYLPKSQRSMLAEKVHPLFATRGVPGTHDIGLGLRVIGALRCGAPVALPRFDKSRDEPRPELDWEFVAQPVDLVIFEGWCVGALPQPDPLLDQPINALERDDDPHGIWRQHANARLAGSYQRLFAELDMLVLLAAPSFEIVAAWRTQQEEQLAHDLAEQRGDAARASFMSPAEIARFVQHYERLTRHILAEMPQRADLTIRLDTARNVTSWSARPHADTVDRLS